MNGMKRVWISTRQKEFEKAQEFYLRHIKPLERPRQMTLDAFANEFLLYAETNLATSTVQVYRQTFQQFIQIIGNKPLRLLSLKDVEEYKRLRKEQVKEVTVNIGFRHLKSAFTYAVKNGYLNDNPFRKSKQLRVPYKDPVYLTTEDFKILISAIEDQEFMELIVFATFSMLRRNELLNLKWSDIDFERGTMRVHNTPGFIVKGNKPRNVPLHLILQQMLMQKLRRGEFVFLDQAGNPFRPQTLSKRFKHLVRQCGISEEVHFHSLRHTGASWLAQLNVPLFTIQKILGHSTPAVTQIYAHLSNESMNGEINRLKIELPGQSENDQIKP